MSSIKKTGAGIRRAVVQLKAAYVGSVSQSSMSVKLITTQTATDAQKFVTTVENSGDKMSSELSHKIQETVDEEHVNPISERQNIEKARIS